jgi:DNA helicase-2/ATP-dependent DNA helicase PcrA
MSTKEFKSAWDELEPIQREAAAWDKGALLVLAGPGSGKTRVLTCRIAYLLDSSPDQNFRILALTFTNKAADEMRVRVRNFVPGKEARLFLGTFYSFCADVLRQHGSHLKINPNFNIYSQDADLTAVLNEAVEKAKRKSDLISDLDKKTLPVIQRLKTRLIAPDKSASEFQDPQFQKRIPIVYQAYEDELAKRNALDFNSLILRTYELFTKFPAFAKRYRTVYPYICIDEFQDTNEAQYALIRALTEDKHKNIFVVADDDQIIYQWNGASHQRIVHFRNDYEAALIQLPVVYRCPPAIVNLANNLIRHNFLRTPDKTPLQPFNSTSRSDPAAARLLPVFADFEAESAGIAADIKARHETNLGVVTVLARNRKLLEGVETALRNENLNAVIAQRKDEFQSAPLVWLHSILRLANERQNRDYLENVSGTFRFLTDVDTNPEDIVTQAESANRDYLQHWIKTVLACQTLSDPQARRIVEAASKFLGEGRDFREFVRTALEWFDNLKDGHVTTDNSATERFSLYDEERKVWDELTREIVESLGPDMTVEGFLQELQMQSKESPVTSNSVTLMTIHGAKGKEFDHVYLIGMVEDELPSFQSKKKGDNSPELEEERRNCFVAITRTKRTLTMSYAEQYRGWPKEPSRFLFEMGLLNRSKQ